MGADLSRETPSKVRRSAWKDPGRAGFLWLGLIVVLCLGLKVRQNALPFFTGADGGLYTNVAEHVRNGDGLVTDISPYHHGYETLPHATAIYPAWPLVYGYASRLAPLRLTGVWLPTLGYVVALIFAYLWAGRIGLAQRFRLAPGLNAGHVLVLFLGLNGRFFTFTSLPYTEGLGFALLFAALWRFRKIGSASSLWTAAEMGIWLAALMLVRSQFLVVALAAFLGLATLAVARRGPGAWLRLVAAASVFAALIFPWAVHVSRIVPRAPLTALLRYDQARATDLLSPLPMLIGRSGIAGRWHELVLSLKTAFSPRGDEGYFANFHGLVLALPLVLVLLGSTWPTRRRSHSSPEHPERPEGWGFDGPFLFWLALGSFASLQLARVDLDLQWLFNQRHATILVVPLFLMWAICARSKKTWAAGAAAAIAVMTVLPGFLDCWTSKTEIGVAAERIKPLAQWLQQREPERSPAVVVAAGTLPQLLSPGVPGVGFHCVYPATTERDLSTLFEKLGGELLILEGRDTRGQSFFRNVDPDWFGRYFVREGKLPGFTVYLRRREPVRTDLP